MDAFAPQSREYSPSAVEKHAPYCLRTLAAPARCYACSLVLEPGVSGHYYNHPLCRDCLRKCQPELAALLDSPAAAAATLARSPHCGTCVRCRRPIRSWLSGRSREGLCCRRCLVELEPVLAAVLTLEEGARSLVEDEAPTSQYVELVRLYAAALRGPESR